MRYEKGTMELSPARDIPLLQHVLRSGFVTGNQLYEFMRLEQTEGSRQAFDHRLRRLVGHGLIEKRPGLARGRHQVYSVTKDGASVLIDAGELFAGRRNVDVVKQSCAHWLELNEVHLALWRSRTLVRWTPATEICSQNLTSYRYAKDYDAVVAVDCDGNEGRFALEYERTPKTFGAYGEIANALEDETLVDTILYLASNFHLMCIVRDRVAPQRVRVCVGLVGDFMDLLLRTPVMIAGTSQRDIPFQQILVQPRERRARQ
jgi:DNA-binding HxlR family transcriptional regulator